MDFNTMVNNLTWKKLAVVTLGLVLTLGFIHEIVFWTFFHNFKEEINQFNKQFSQQQSEIREVLARSDREFSKREKAFDNESEQFQKMVEKKQRDLMGYMTKMEKEQEEREKSFSQSFKEAPQKMWEAHEKFGQDLRKNFIDEAGK